MSGKKPVVAVVKGSDVRKITREAINLAGGLAGVVKPDMTVLVKPNLGIDLPFTTGATTNPVVVATVVEMLKEIGVKRVIVGECAVVGYDAGKIFDKLGVREIFEKAGAEVVNMDEDTTVEVEIPNGKVLKKMRVNKTAVDSDFIISVPVMKTHILVKASLGLKNMKGILPDSTKKRMHRVGMTEVSTVEHELEHAIVDLNTVFKPNFTVIDGIVAQEGYAPGNPGISGSPLPFDTVIAGFDAVATDAVGVHLMGMDPMDVRHIRIAYERGLGEARIDQIETVGTPVGQVRKIFRVPSADQVNVHYGKIKLRLSNGCSGCRETAVLALADLTPEEIAAIGEAELLVGAASTAENPDARIFLVGNCTRNLPYPNGYKINGCPPPIFYTKKCLKGEEDTVKW